ncbi:unannotated protein [freshwater metagenome]|uniref:Unannotated protein n=1 Tax=freshwater metagenome TaxID=449393 RepID=A0A6J6DN06_9ZZZZ
MLAFDCTSVVSRGALMAFAESGSTSFGSDVSTGVNRESPSVKSSTPAGD